MTIIPRNDLLKRVHIAAPCPADWDKMVGDERVRFCGSCRLNVYNLSDMTRAEAESLVRAAEGDENAHVCVRFYRRADGTMLTQDCPAGLLQKAAAGVRRRLAFYVSCGVALAVSGLGWARGQQERLALGDEVAAIRQQPQTWRAEQPAPVRRVLERIDPQPSMTMGAVAAPRPQQPRPLLGRVVMGTPLPSSRRPNETRD